MHITKCRVNNTEYKVQNSEYRVHDTENRERVMEGVGERERARVRKSYNESANEPVRVRKIMGDCKCRERDKEGKNEKV